MIAGVTGGSPPATCRSSSGSAGLERDSMVNVSQLMSVNRADLAESVGLRDSRTVRRLDDGRRLVLQPG